MKPEIKQRIEMIRNGIVPDGYKKTRLGIIPEEWNIFKLKKMLEDNMIVSHLDGNHGSLYPRANEFVNDGVPYISANSIVNGRIDFCNAKYLTYQRAKKFVKGVAKNNDVIFAHNATVGPVALLETNLEFVILSTSLTYYRCNANVIIPKYLKNYMESYIFQNQFKKIMKQTTRNQLPITTQRSLYHILPELPEQHHIAAILSTWDKTIELKENIIQQKKLQKKGLMQQLLTGKKRIPGFSGEWKEVRLGEVLIPITRIIDWDDEKLYNLVSVRRASGGIFFRESLYGNQIKTKVLQPIKRGDFLISKMQILHGALSVVTEKFEDMYVSSSYIILQSKNEDYFDINFFNYLTLLPIMYHKAYISSYGVHIEKMTFNLKLYLKEKILIPPTIKEQQTIGEILSTADKEIKLLETELANLKEQKKGLMQLLLTGIVRVTI